jgi:hypothetical protein
VSPEKNFSSRQQEAIRKCHLFDDRDNAPHKFRDASMKWCEVFAAARLMASDKETERRRTIQNARPACCPFFGPVAALNFHHV